MNTAIAIVVKHVCNGLLFLGDLTHKQSIHRSFQFAALGLENIILIMHEKSHPQVAFSM
jgi:hypothetical protein